LWDFLNKAVVDRPSLWTDRPILYVSEGFVLSAERFDGVIERTRPGKRIEPRLIGVGGTLSEAVVAGAWSRELLPNCEVEGVEDAKDSIQPEKVWFNRM
jgi:hypothetical protein